MKRNLLKKAEFPIVKFMKLKLGIKLFATSATSLQQTSSEINTHTLFLLNKSSVFII